MLDTTLEHDSCFGGLRFNFNRFEPKLGQPTIDTISNILGVDLQLTQLYIDIYSCQHKMTHFNCIIPK